MASPPDAGAVIVAAGRGSRALRGGAETPKQFRLIAGQPLLLRALRPFLEHPRVGPIVVVLPPEHAAAPPSWLQALLSERLLVTAGGAERQQSVANGLQRLPPGPSLVLVHDAARPFVEPELIDRVLAVAALGAAAVPALPLADTVKETDAAGLVVRTVPRERLVTVQTPQAFPRTMLETAHQRAKADPGAGPATDDAALCERLGHPVRIVAGSARNLKVTTPEDFALAEAIAALDAP
ncbi:MAG: 2-C-methyl-D-erythritol 4-phosphate cytidylyltransferase [Gemmatimonadetes bacterium 21-71-4]|nr:MAG: 2-C-methyl-D-erythritol 4-phosphate cytidylyltransferase [Gemmatimonadetes bacterium 21-71-4]